MEEWTHWQNPSSPHPHIPNFSHVPSSSIQWKILQLLLGPLCLASYFSQSTNSIVLALLGILVGPNVPPISWSKLSQRLEAIRSCFPQAYFSFQPETLWWGKCSSIKATVAWTAVLITLPCVLQKPLALCCFLCDVMIPLPCLSHPGVSCPNVMCAGNDSHFVTKGKVRS